jgi:hypothetical protein
LALKESNGLERIVKKGQHPARGRRLSAAAGMKPSDKKRLRKSARGAGMRSSLVTVNLGVFVAVVPNWKTPASLPGSFPRQTREMPGCIL